MVLQSDLDASGRSGACQVPARCWVVLFLAVVSLAWSVPRDTVVLQLKWTHQFQFAGYYLAAQRGYYAAEGIQVVFREGGPRISVAQEVLEGKAQFGIAGSELLLLRAQGKPLIVLAPLYQRSPVVIVARDSILSPSQLSGMRLGYSQGFIPPELVVMLRRNGVDTSAIHLVACQSDPVSMFIHHEIDGFTAYQGVEPEQLLRMGVANTVLSPIRYGVDGFGDVLFTAQGLADTRPDLAERFLRASLRGWDDAVGNIGDAIQAVRHYSKDKTDQELEDEAMAVRELIVPELVQPGYQNQQRWERVVAQYKQYGALPKDFSLKGFLFAPERDTKRFWLLLSALGVGLLFVGIAGMVSFRFNRRLRKEVDLRTKELRKQTIRLEHALKASSDGVWDWPDIGDKTLWWSHRAYALVSLRADSFQPEVSSILQRVHPDDRRRLSDRLYGTRIPQEEIDIEFRFLCGTGEMRWFRLRGKHRWGAEGISGLTAVLQDVHVRKLAELDLRQGEARMRSYFESGLVGMGLLDHEGVLLQSNALLDSVTGRNGVGERFADRLPSGERERFLSVLQKIRSGEFSGWEGVFVLARPNGTSLHLNVSLRPVQEDEVFRHCVMMAQDITEQRMADRHREQLLEELRFKNQSLEGMLYASSHDLRAPLVNLQGFARELQQSLQELEAQMPVAMQEQYQEEVKTSLGFILKSAQRLDKLLEGLLRLSRLGRGLAQVKEIDMVQVIDQVKEELAAQISQNQVHVDVGILPRCKGDESLLYQVVHNLVSNAIKYRHPERIPSVVVGGGRMDGWVVYRFADNGIGIPQHFLGNVFRPFVRVQSDNAPPGEGLGLAIVSRIVEAHRGRIQVESELGEGSCFTVFLPEVPVQGVDSLSESLS